jgi:transposase-like protein
MVLLYLLGLSYGAVSDLLFALGVEVGKTTVYNSTQEAGVESRDHQRAAAAGGGKKAIIGSDGTYVKVKGEQVRSSQNG